MSDDQVVQYVKDAQKMGKNSEADYNRVDEKGALRKNKSNAFRKNMKMEVAVPVHRATRTQQSRVRVLSKMMKVVTQIALKKI